MSKDLADKLRAIRRKLEISQSQAAAAWNIPLRTLQNWEANRNTPRGFALAALNEKLDAILSAPPAKPPKPSPARKRAE